MMGTGPQTATETASETIFMAHGRKRDNRLEPKKEWGTWQPFFVVAVILRILFTLAPSYDVDMTGYLAWSRHLADLGPRDFYATFHVVYAPAYQYLLWLTGEFASLTQMGAASHVQFIKLWAVLADAVGASLLMRLGLGMDRPRAGFALAMLYFMNPAVLFDSSVWGQFDGIPAMLLMLVLLLFLEKKPVAAALIFLLSVLTKPQSGLLTPIVLAAFLHALFGLKWKKWLRTIGLALAAGTGMYLAIILPFYTPTSLSGRIPKWLDPFWWLFDLYLRSIKDYPYGTANAFNLWFPLGGQTVADSTPVLGLPMSTWGFLLTAAGFSLAGWLLLRKPHHPGSLFFASWIALFSAFLFMTKMHERYLVPALLVGTACMLYEFRLAGPFLLVSAVTAFNQWVVYDLSWSLIYWLPVSETRGTVASLLLILAYGWTVFILFRVSGETGTSAGGKSAIVDGPPVLAATETKQIERRKIR